MWIIGDIHGCFRELEILLGKIPGDEYLLFVGDYVDRGPDSYRVIERLLIEKKRSIFLLGNHEDMMINYLKNPGNPHLRDWLHINNGGMETLNSYLLPVTATIQSLPPSHQEFLLNLRLYHENESFIAVHAGLRINGCENMENQKREDLLWIRHEWLSNEHKWTGKHVYFGHTPLFLMKEGKSRKDFFTGNNSTGIDTGCVYGGYLSAINTVSKKTIQVKSFNN